MKIIEVEYRELVSEGFNNKTIGARAIVEDGETPGVSLLKLRAWVRNELETKESLTYFQKCQIAKEVINKIANEVIPF